MPYLIAQEGPLKGLSFSLHEGEEWIIGRDRDQADLFIDDTTVSRKQARLTKTDEGLFLKNLSRTNPTLINDEPARGNALLKEGDLIAMGESLFLFSEEPAGEETPPTAQPKNNAAYDDIFGDLQEPDIPPEPEPLEPVTPPLEEEEEEESLSLGEPAKTAYDTIFEDVESDVEMPFNLLAETPLVLKVIGGPNAGAEIGLEKGRSYLLGKDSTSCDIVFQDLSVSRNHAKITISNDGIIELEDLGSKNSTIVNGTPVSEKKMITSQDLIAMGTTIFLIIDREAAQETIYSPVLPAYEVAQTEKIQEELEEKEEISANKKTDWKQQKIPSKHLVAAGALAAMFLIVFLSFFSLFKSEELDIAHKAPQSVIEEALKPYKGVHYTYNPASGKLFLAGDVLTNIAYQEMLFHLNQIPHISNLENNVVIDEGVSKSMNEVLSANEAWRSVAIRAEKPGQFIAQGSVQTADDAEKLSEYLTGYFPYTEKLQNRIVIEEVLQSQIQAMIQAGGFGVLTAQLNGSDLIIGGRYSEKREKEYKKLLAQLKEVDGIRGVRSFAVATKPSDASIDLSKQYAVTGTSRFDHDGFSAIINGQMYMLGQSINGMTITSIEPNEILLEKDGLKYKIDYTR